MSTPDPILEYVKGQGWVYKARRTPQEIVDAWTWEKGQMRSGRTCKACGHGYHMHAGDSCDYPYNGREWTD